MTTSKEETPSGLPRPSTASRFPKLEEAYRKLFRSPIAKNDRTVFNALATIQFGTIELIVPLDRQGGAPKLNIATTTTTATTSATTIPVGDSLSTIPSSAASLAQLSLFPQNVAAPSLHVALPPQGTRLATTTQLAYLNQLIRTQPSPSSDDTSASTSAEASLQASIDFVLQDQEEQSRISEITIKVVEEFMADNTKTSEKIAEFALLGPYLDQEFQRKTLNFLIAEFETAKLLDIDLLQGLVQLVQSAGNEYLHPDDFVRILAILRFRLQDIHQQTTKHTYYLILALSHLLDMVVDGKVQDLKCVVDHEPLSTLLRQLMESSNVHLKHQAAYALQGLIHVPSDETRREFVLRHAGNITMGLLGVASVCKLHLSGSSEGAGKLCDATVSMLEIGTKVVVGAQSLYESGQGITASVMGGIFFGRRLLWYTALREAREHIQSGRLADFNRLVFEAPCSRNVEFQWGVCQFLGEIAIDPRWDVSTRQHATEFLAELYRNDTICNSNKEIDSWILQIIRQVVASPDAATSSHGQLLIQGLDKIGNISKQALYRDVMDGPMSSYPLRTHSPAPLASPLLARVQADVEYDLHRLRVQRLKERDNALYIPPQAKPTLQSSDITLFPLMEKMLRFLAGSGQVFLLLGDSGGGKSTFSLQLEHNLWKDYKRGGAIPLHINLPAIDGPHKNMIDKHLRQLRLFSEAQIQELRQSRDFVVICDGYDESHLKQNLYATNLFNQPEQWKAKIIISCRSQYLGSDYRSQFQPTNDRYQQPIAELSQEAVIASFSRSQIEQYVEQFVQKAPSCAADPTQLSWTVADYMDKLNKIPKLIDLVSNPFLLTLALRALPNVVRSGQNLSNIRLNRVGLYDNFIEQWLQTNKQRLEGSTLSTESRAALDELLDADFIQLGISYQKNLAAAIFEHQRGNPIVKYVHYYEKLSWKAAFFSTDTKITMLRESSPLTRSSHQYRFLHRSILEYLYSRVMSDPFESIQTTAHISSGYGESKPIESFVTHPLNQRSIVSESSVLQFLAERVELDPLFKSRLLAAIYESKADARVSTASANAISILVKAGVQFNGADLRGIRIPGADICGGKFDSADMQGADLSEVNLTRTWLRQANLSETKMSEVQFRELPYLDIGEGVVECIFSSDGALLVISTRAREIVVYETATWTKIVRHDGGYAFAISPTTRELAKHCKHSVQIGDILTGKTRLVLFGHSYSVTHISYSPDGEMIVTIANDDTIRIWSTSSGDTLHVFHGHADSVIGVDFSPNGLQLVSCSEDMTLRTWGIQTGERLLTLENHRNRDFSAEFSPNGRQIASGDDVKKLTLWASYTGIFNRACGRRALAAYSVMHSLNDGRLASCDQDVVFRPRNLYNGNPFGTPSDYTVSSIVFSPDNKYVASFSDIGTVRLWSVERPSPREEPEDGMVEWLCVGMSPDGSWTATGNRIGTVQFWETRTGNSGVILMGHVGYVCSVAFSPCGALIASASVDGTVRLWCAHTGRSVNVLEGHTDSVYSVVFSPYGHQLASCGPDKTVRLWNSKTGEPGLILEGHTDAVNAVVFSPSGHQIASCSEDKTVRLWCSLTGEQLMVLHHEEALGRVMFSPDGLEVISVNSVSWAHGDLSCWDSHSGEEINQATLKEFNILCCSYSPCGKLLATGEREGMLRLWNRNLGGDHWSEVYRSIIGPYTDIQWIQGQDGMYLATSGHGIVRVWIMMEVGESYTLRMLWSLGEKNALSLTNADLSGAVGLSPVDLKFVRKHGAITESSSESE